VGYHKPKIIIPDYRPFLRAQGWAVYQTHVGTSPLWVNLKLIHEAELGKPRRRGAYRVVRLSWGVEPARLARGRDLTNMAESYPALVAAIEAYCKEHFTVADVEKRLGLPALATYREAERERIKNQAARRARAADEAAAYDEDIERALDALM
jgi:hypothetical protein